MNPQELYNLHHAELRNIIERIIGVLKRRFRILTTSPEYDMNVQARIPASLACVHNIICMHDSDELQDFLVEDGFQPYDSEDGGGSIADGIPTQEERAWMSGQRDRISEAMWVGYLAEQRVAT